MHIIAMQSDVWGSDQIRQTDKQTDRHITVMTLKIVTYRRIAYNSLRVISAYQTHITVMTLKIVTGVYLAIHEFAHFSINLLLVALPKV